MYMYVCIVKVCMLCTLRRSRMLCKYAVFGVYVCCVFIYVCNVLLCYVGSFYYARYVCLECVCVCMYVWNVCVHVCYV